MKHQFAYLLAVACLFFCIETQSLAETYEADVVVYGGTSAAITAALQVSQSGHSVIVVSPDKHLGGLTSGGLGWTDSGNKSAIGGLSSKFYSAVNQHYEKPESWTWQSKEEFGDRNRGSGRGSNGRTMWVFEPHVAEQIFERWVKENNLKVVRDQWLDRGDGGVSLDNGRITQIRTLSGDVYRGKMFIDTTYEGDLMAAAGVSYHVGREANSVYDENWNGVQTGVLHHSHWFKNKIDPYVVPGDKSSGLLPEISEDPPGEKGDGDKRIQAYCFRMCLTNVAENRIPFPKPEGYDGKRYELLGRVLDAGWRQLFNKFDAMPNYKTDTNNHGPFSSDYIGGNYDYPEADYQRRNEIIEDHKLYQQGVLYFLTNDLRVPADVREKMSKWGLPKDEFQSTGGWPHQLYVREARRMVGHYVMTEHDCLGRKKTPDSIGMGSYTLDSHNVQRYIKPDGYVQNEGDIGVKTPRAYQVAYGSIVPKKSECTNLFVPVCVSSSHIAFGSIRMEPVFMILGQSAATAACIAIDDNLPVQDVPYQKLRKQLIADGQVLELGTKYEFDAKTLPGITIDDMSATLTGLWSTSAVNRRFVNSNYRHDGSVGEKELKTATFATKLKPGRYEVRISYPPNSNRASNVLVNVGSADGVKSVRVNQKQSPEIDGLFHSVGTFEFGDRGEVTISNQGADGYVIIDSVQFLKR